MPRALAPLASLVTLVTLGAGCGQADPGTSVRLALHYDASLGLDTADVTLRDRTESGAIAPELLLLVPDDLTTADLPIEVWGRAGGRRAAYGTGVASPRPGETVAATVELAACAPSCNGMMLAACGGVMQACALGCSEVGDAHCIAPTPSNAIDPALANGLGGTTVIGVDTTIDADTGRITGAFERPAGEHVIAGVGYDLVPQGNRMLAVFSFHSLTITGKVLITGSHAVVLLVGDAARIGGVIDVAGGTGDHATPGPGGGLGASESHPENGCGGGQGASTDITDGGGGGGGGGEDGGPGGPGANGATAPGAVGMRCFGPAGDPGRLEPLIGGGGGGRGGQGTAASAARGGGGGGALQITALGSLDVTGVIDAGGAGGEAGPGSLTNSGAGAGGGAGGAILLEAPRVTVADGAFIVANGGGGGGGGGTNGVVALPGDHAQRTLFPAVGGTGADSNNGGGSGGYIGGGPDVGGMGPQLGDGGGGGGGVGGIVIRGRQLSVAGTISPRAVQADLKPPR